MTERCKQCNKLFSVDVERSNSDRDLCRSCAKTASAAICQSKRDNEGWLERALEEGIPLWEQQPGEGNDEYEMWQAYMQLWPEVRPTVSKTAASLGISVATVQRAYTKWTWGARLQSWIREVTAEKTAKLRHSRQEMVEQHIEMGKLMREKAMLAIEAFDPFDVTPNELVSILKETQRLESTSRDMMDDIEKATAEDVEAWSPVAAPQGLFVDPDASAGVLPGPHGGLNEAGLMEVVDILANAGVLKVSQTVEVSRADAPIEVQGYAL